MNERAWWIFHLPTSPGIVKAILHVPADTEAQAREAMRRPCYKGAPVDSWPCVGSRWATREAVSR